MEEYFKPQIDEGHLQLYYLVRESTNGLTMEKILVSEIESLPPMAFSAWASKIPVFTSQSFLINKFCGDSS